MEASKERKGMERKGRQQRWSGQINLKKIKSGNRAGRPTVHSPQARVEMERGKRGGDVVKAAASDGVRRKLNTSCLATVFFSLPSLHWFFRQAAAERGREREERREGTVLRSGNVST